MRALVTGAATKGIGGAICMRLARDALARGQVPKIVACASGRNDGLGKLTAELRALGAQALALSGDLADPAVPQRLVDEALEFCGGLDGLVSNAGHAHPARLTDLAVADWDRMHAVHSRAAWLLAKAAHPALKQSGGAMVATSSINGDFGHIGHGAYASAKAALNVMCRTLALEWARDGVRVNLVSPGLVRTGMSEAAHQDPAFKAHRETIIPLARVGQPDDVAGVVAFLLGPDAGFVTGENIFVDGGFARAGLNRMVPRREGGMA
jgi:NAD(P)-dependent dehydrogenase (short-subunit alcohol dehydrogenase family)